MIQEWKSTMMPEVDIIKAPPANSPKEKLLIEVSRMYYIYGYSQKKISEILRLSRAYICQLLEAARQLGIVEINVKDFSAGNLELEDWLTRTYPLKSAKVFSGCSPFDKSELIKRMSAGVWDILSANLRDQAVLAFSWGNTIYNMARQMDGESGAKNVSVVPITGGMTSADVKVFTSETSSYLARAFGGTPYIIPLPALVDNTEIRDAVYSDGKVHQLMEMAACADAALFTVGSPGEDNSIFRSGFITKSDIRHLGKQGMVGDFAAHFLDDSGQVCDLSYDLRTVSVPLESLRKIPLKICVVYDMHKAHILSAVLNGGFIDYLFVDDGTVNLIRNAAVN